MARQFLYFFLFLSLSASGSNDPLEGGCLEWLRGFVAPYSDFTEILKRLETRWPDAEAEVGERVARFFEAQLQPNASRRPLNQVLALSPGQPVDMGDVHKLGCLLDMATTYEIESLHLGPECTAARKNALTGKADSDGAILGFFLERDMQIWAARLLPLLFRAVNLPRGYLTSEDLPLLPALGEQLSSVHLQSNYSPLGSLRLTARSSNYTLHLYGGPLGTYLPPILSLLLPQLFASDALKRVTVKIYLPLSWVSTQTGLHHLGSLPEEAQPEFFQKIFSHLHLSLRISHLVHSSDWRHLNFVVLNNRQVAIEFVSGQ